ncbi:tyrosine-type recombinase/integrase [Streptomyces mirabilis]|uniref:tyrosine-type recombinase/integrase n=1 Tax=Streptomyces mirabilis TaxID=68239 RepID=UPI0021BF2437|nr:tyrosine-type recombinase/integrase [Streptomyces mirabilis]MCT9107600.1 tyrosine-type recombinase/integrase [Streptomyces mirabilis]
MIDDSTYELHREASAYLDSLRARHLSWNTERVYAGRSALYLTTCAAHGVDWSRPTLGQLARFMRRLVQEPLPSRRRDGGGQRRFRSEETANAVMTTVCELLRFGARYGWVPAEVAAQLTQQKYLSYLPPGYNAGEDGQFRTVRARELKFVVVNDGIDWLTFEEVEQLLAVTDHARDRFLVALLWCTALRIGEALGLRREDMHLLSNSRSLGCRVEGPHVHVRRRLNENGALAKSREPRSVPVTEELVALYTEYVYEREQVAEAVYGDMVFVNLFRGVLGRGMTYSTAKDLFDRLARRAELTARPHMLRHGAATAWIRAGQPPDVVQKLLGHLSSSSMVPYIHASEADKRAAVEYVAARHGGVA